MRTSNTDRGRWLRRYAAATVLGFGALVLPVLWFAIVRAYMDGSWQITLYFDMFGEGHAELVLLTLLIPFSWLGLLGFHELVREANHD